jgi:hypothetical protein
VHRSVKATALTACDFLLFLVFFTGAGAVAQASLCGTVTASEEVSVLLLLATVACF